MQFKKELYTITDFHLILESKRKIVMSISNRYMILVNSIGSERAVLKSGSHNKFSFTMLKLLGIPLVYKQSQFHYNLELNSKASHTILNYWLK